MVIRAVLSDSSMSIVIYRIMQALNRLPYLKNIAPIFCKINSILCGAVIGCKADFGPGFVIMHSVGIVINSKVVGGEYIIIESGVVIGDEKGLAPKLGNNIFIGSGAKLFGGITVGDYVKIGANAVVNKDIPNNTTAIGVPAKIIKKIS